jgi:hypothetical protein
MIRPSYPRRWKGVRIPWTFWLELRDRRLSTCDGKRGLMGSYAFIYYEVSFLASSYLSC